MLYEEIVFDDFPRNNIYSKVYNTIHKCVGSAENPHSCLAPIIIIIIIIVPFSDPLERGRR